MNETPPAAPHVAMTRAASPLANCSPRMPSTAQARPTMQVRSWGPSARLERANGCSCSTFADCAQPTPTALRQKHGSRGPDGVCRMRSPTVTNGPYRPMWPDPNLHSLYWLACADTLLCADCSCGLEPASPRRSHATCQAQSACADASVDCPMPAPSPRARMRHARSPLGTCQCQHG